MEIGKCSNNLYRMTNIVHDGSIKPTKIKVKITIFHSHDSISFFILLSFFSGQRSYFILVFWTMLLYGGNGVRTSNCVSLYTAHLYQPLDIFGRFYYASSLGIIRNNIIKLILFFIFGVTSISQRTHLREDDVITKGKRKNFF